MRPVNTALQESAVFTPIIVDVHSTYRPGTIEYDSNECFIFGEKSVTADSLSFTVLLRQLSERGSIVINNEDNWYRKWTKKSWQ